ncbi:transposase, partial [Roseovarius sp. A46]|uniref:transposase n=1 Tax=Roseovarius sp. A46 TaxID=2109331 RepID=UPI0013E96579
RRRKLTPQERARNVEIGVTRGRVEAIFGHWKRHWGLRRTRFLGGAKMQVLTRLAAIGWNLWKGAGFKARYG